MVLTIPMGIMITMVLKQYRSLLTNTAALERGKAANIIKVDSAHELDVHIDVMSGPQAAARQHCHSRERAL